MRAFDDPETVLSYCQSQQMREDGSIASPDYLDYVAELSGDTWRADHVADGADEIARHLAVKNTIPNVSGALLRREPLLQVMTEHFDRIARLRVAGDWLVYVLCLEHGRLAFSAQALNLHRRHAAGIAISTAAAADGNADHLREILAVQRFVADRHPVPDAVRRKAPPLRQGDLRAVRPRPQLRSEARRPRGVGPGTPSRGETRPRPRAGGALRRGARRPVADAYRPQLGFMIVGAQKAGTSALASFLYQHPEICMSMPKEAHLFDAPDYSSDWTPAQIDERYRPCFAHCDAGTLRGEATPIYLFLPAIAGELKRYNPDLKLVVLLRDPVESAPSRTTTWRRTGTRSACRCGWRCSASRSDCGGARTRRTSTRTCAGTPTGGAASTACSYGTSTAASTATGVLVVRSEDLLQRHDTVLRRVFGFLGVSPDVRVPPRYRLRRRPRRPAAPRGGVAARAVVPRRGPAGAAPVARRGQFPARDQRGEPVVRPRSGCR